MRPFFILLTGVMLVWLVGGCATEKEQLREAYEEELRVDEIDDGTYMIVASMSGQWAMQGYAETMKRSVLKKAREHCAQQNKAVKLLNREGQGGSASQSFGGVFGGGGVTGMSGSSSGTGAHFDIVFTCRERTTPAPTKGTKTDAP